MKVVLHISPCVHWGACHPGHILLNSLKEIYGVQVDVTETGNLASPSCIVEYYHYLGHLKGKIDLFTVYLMSI